MSANLRKVDLCTCHARDMELYLDYEKVRKLLTECIHKGLYLAGNVAGQFRKILPAKAGMYREIQPWTKTLLNGCRFSNAHVTYHSVLSRMHRLHPSSHVRTRVRVGLARSCDLCPRLYDSLVRRQPSTV